MEDQMQQLQINDVPNPLSVWVYKGERYFTQLCVVNVPHEKVLEFLFEVHDIQARLCTAEETAGTFVNGDQVFIRVI
jgi:hypothetical protein